MSGGPEGNPMGPMGPNTMGPVINGDGLDGMKNSPANGGPSTPREDSGSGMGDYNLGGFGGPGENVSIGGLKWMKIEPEVNDLPFEQRSSTIKIKQEFSLDRM